MEGEGGSCEKDLILVGRVPQTRREITEGTIRESKLVGEGWKGETAGQRSEFYSGFVVDEIGLS